MTTRRDRIEGVIARLLPNAGDVFIAEFTVEVEAALGPDDRDAWKADAERLAAVVRDERPGYCRCVQCRSDIQSALAAHDALIAHLKDDQ